MNQQRLQAYIALIQKLLACPGGEEWILLRQNEALVTPELVQVMEQVATQLANQGNLKEAKFLHNLAGQIHHLFLAQTAQHAGDEDHSQSYLELIQALLDCPKGSEEELLAAHQELIGPGLVQKMQQVAAQVASNGDQEAAHYLQHWATELSQLWLQQHDFQPIWKKEPEPKSFDQIPVPAAPPPLQAMPVAPPPNRTLPVEVDQDFWAEPSANGVQSKLQSPPQTAPEPTQLLTEQQGTDSEPLPMAIYEQINHQLETIAGALTKLSEVLTAPAAAAADPLRYMETLEHAYAGNWVLTSAELQALIGVQPTCPKGSESFQRGCWIFVKAGKVGTQTGWRIQKANELQG